MEVYTKKKNKMPKTHYTETSEIKSEIKKLKM